MRNIDKYLAIAKKEGWSTYVEEFEDGHSIDVDFGCTISANQDFHMNISIDRDDPDELIKQIYKYWEGFEPGEESSVWANFSDKDMQEVKDMIIRLHNSLQVIPDIEEDFLALYDNAMDELLESNIDDKTPTAAYFIEAYCLDGNYYGDCFILLGNEKIAVESIYSENNDAMVHLSCEAFEADVKIVNLSIDNIERVMNSLYHAYKETKINE